MVSPTATAKAGKAWQQPVKRLSSDGRNHHTGQNPHWNLRNGPATPEAWNLRWNHRTSQNQPGTGDTLRYETTETDELLHKRYAGQFQMFLIMFQHHVNFCSRSTLQNTTDSRCYSHVRKHRIQFVSVCFLNLIIRWIHNSLGAEPPEGSLRDLHQASPASPSSSASQVWELGNPKKLVSVDLNFWCAGDCWNHVVCEEHPAHWPSIAPHAESPLVWKPRDQLTSSSSGKHSERQVVPEVRRPLGLVCEASTVQPVPGPSSLFGFIPIGSSWHSVSIFLLILMNFQVTYGFSKVRQLWQHVDIRCIVDRYMI